MNDVLLSSNIITKLQSFKRAVEHLNNVINGWCFKLSVLQKLIYLKESPVQTWMCKNKDNRLPIIYLPTFSEIEAWDFYLGSAGIFEDDTIISEDSRRSPKSLEDVRSLPTAKL